MKGQQILEDIEVLRESIQVAPYETERVVYLVGHPCRELTNGSELFGLGKLFGHGGLFLFGLFPAGYIPVDAPVPVKTAVRAVKRNAAGLQHHGPAVLVQISVLKVIKRLQLLYAFQENSSHAAGFLRRHEVKRSFAYDLGRLVPEDIE